MKLLITGATGNVGSEVLKQLESSGHELFAGVRDKDRARQKLGDAYSYCVVDFDGRYPQEPFDAVFLVRPPQLAKPEPFRAFLEALAGKPKIVFLSVQGAESRAYLPHAKIEKVISGLGLPHVFIRPSYFMENLTTTLWPELEQRGRVYLPSGKLEFNWIALGDVAALGAVALTEPLQENALTATNTEVQGFQEVVDIINELCGTDLVYSDPSLAAYLWHSFKMRQGFGYTLVMLLLHYLPRFSRAATNSSDVERILGRPPLSLKAFIRQNQKVFRQLAR